MRRPSVIEYESQQIVTVKDLTGVFESIASTQVAKVKSKVELSKQFFYLLWERYCSLRIDPKTRITRAANTKNSKKVFVLISAEAGLSGDIDQRLIETMLKDYDKNTTDIVVLGTHGATQLAQRGIPFARYFQVPETDEYINVDPVVEAVRDYSKIIIYFEEYLSLGQQSIRTIDLISSIKEMGEDVSDGEQTMTDADTIFEPSLNEIADQMESTMMSLAFSQTILESSLAQAASRFNAMTVAKQRATELLGSYMWEYHRAKRAESDRRLREVMVGLKKKKLCRRGHL